MEAERARRWWEKGQLSTIYPDGVPVCVAAAVDLADRTAGDFAHERNRLIAEDAEQERKRAANG